jgi:two-component system, LuxR family, response regulator FixJ
LLDADALMLDQVVKKGPQAAARRPVVTVVDDDPAVCGSLKFALELEGFAVRTYLSAAEVLRAELDACDCFVIDQRMPGMTGIELIEMLRSHKVSTPAILIISHSNATVSARAARAAIPIVEKPLLGNALVERIREACGLS